MAAVRGRLTWQLGEVTGVAWETPHAKRLFLEVPGWEGHEAGQHVDLLTAEDGYQAEHLPRRAPHL